MECCKIGALNENVVGILDVLAPKAAPWLVAILQPKGQEVFRVELSRT